MAANVCKACDANWPKHHHKCPGCGGTVVSSSAKPVMSEDEYSGRMGLIRARRGDVLPLAADVQAECDREWARAEDIASRTSLSVADLIDGAPRNPA